jgi:general L-amino acid transport system substrate-binding protein
MPVVTRDSPTLKAVRARGRLNCGVHPGLAGFAFRDSRGVWNGFDADFCRATAAAVLGSRDAVNFRPLGADARFPSLINGEVDVLWRNTSRTFVRDASLGVDFAGSNYYDGQGFMVRRALRLTSAAELGGARVCVQRGSTAQQNVADYFRGRGLQVEMVVVETDADGRAAYQREACDAYAADVSTLASSRSVLNDPAAHILLPDVISKEPLGPVVRQGDATWTDIVRWTLNVMILAEELGVTSRNVEELRETSTSPEIRRLLGVEGGYGPMLGLKEDWAYQVILQVGNYGEVFEANLGARSPLRLERGLNALWTAEQPGLMYAPPMG